MADNNKPHNSAPDDNAFDNITRILASPMPRRQAFKLAGMALSSIAVSVLIPKGAFADEKAANKPLSASQILKMPLPHSLSKQQTALSVMHILWEQYGVPISFIEAKSSQLLSFNVGLATVKDVLNQIVKQDISYRWQVVQERIVLYPVDHEYEIVTSGVDIINIPRSEAVGRYTLYLRGIAPGFKHIGATSFYIGAVLTGGSNPTVTLNDVPVSLSPRATVLQHFVELLGADKTAYFFVTIDQWGRPIFYYNQVKVTFGSEHKAASYSPRRWGT